MGDSIDAVTVSTPDHMHFHASLARHQAWGSTSTVQKAAHPLHLGSPHS